MLDKPILSLQRFFSSSLKPYEPPITKEILEPPSTNLSSIYCDKADGPAQRIPTHAERTDVEQEYIGVPGYE